MRRLPALVFLGLLIAPSVLLAQNADGNWVFRTRAVATGVSDSSDPEGYKVYSGLAMDADLTRNLGRHFALDWTVGTQSREVEHLGPSGGKTNLGSVEVLPASMLLQFRLHPGGRFHPYVGVGATLTVFWEKSGSLDSADLDPKIGPTAQVGFDYDISSRMVFNAEFRATRLETDLEVGGKKAVTLSLHPSTLAAGIGFRF